jgi:hypothetical protein
MLEIIIKNDLALAVFVYRHQGLRPIIDVKQIIVAEFTVVSKSV